MTKEWKDVDWKSLANILKEEISRAKDGTITIRTEEIAKTIEKPEALLGAVYWFSFVNLFEEGIVTNTVKTKTGETVMQFRLRRPADAWENLYELAADIEKLKDLKIGIEMLLEQF